jgi:cobalt-zinc-cadmium efflux system protein
MRRARQLLAACVVTLGLVVGKALLAWRGGSLALASDAAHSLADAAVLAAAYWAARLGDRAADERMTWGYLRAGVLVGFVSGLALWAIALGVGWDAVVTLEHPAHPSVSLMAAGGVLGFLVNGALALLLGGRAASERDPHPDLNLRGAWLHVAGDSAASFGVVLAAVAIAWRGWGRADPAAALAIALAVAWAALGLVREAWRVLMEGSPTHLDAEHIARAITAFQGVQGVHHLHVWSVVPGQAALSAHVRVAPETTLAEGQLILRDVHAMLHQRFGIAHTTLQMEVDECEEPRHGGHDRDRDRGSGMLE